ncbi:MAG: hypothetical protein HDR04_19425 [Lachnospiraceae bacterium]|nr:hypothetical protein [Lachnospiraceae bacterium]
MGILYFQGIGYGIPIYKIGGVYMKVKKEKIKQWINGVRAETRRERRKTWEREN